MNNTERDIKINEFLDWLDSEAEFFHQNPQVNHTYNGCSAKLKEILAIKERIECPYGTCNRPSGHKNGCNQFDSR